MTALDLLAELTASCNTARSVLPDLSDIAPSEHGISLFDVKNDLFLSYIQTLALRNLAIVKSIKDGQEWADIAQLNDALTRELVQQRVYLEKGVRPLEQRLKYQVDKVLKAASDQDAREAKASARTTGQHTREESENSEDEEIEELAYRPNPAAFATTQQDDTVSRLAKSKQDGVYRPPRVSATAMPDIDQKERRERKPARSTTVDEYIANEMSTAPIAQPSVGSTILDGGRRTKNARALAEEAERKEYEETHLVRLPTDSKKERARKKARDRTGYGGEELRGLGENVDRIADLTRKTKTNALERSRKRRAVEDGPRGDGMDGAFEVKRKRMEKKLRR